MWSEQGEGGSTAGAGPRRRPWKLAGVARRLRHAVGAIDGHTRCALILALLHTVTHSAHIRLMLSSVVQILPVGPAVDNCQLTCARSH